MRKNRPPGDDRLISGKLRLKAGRAGAPATTVAVDGAEYAWSFRHGWRVWGKDIKVVSVSVALKPLRTRELILDFTVKAGADGSPPSDARVERALAAAIRAAIQAGWDPESRGRAFRMDAAETD
jgi:hypothetical protein